MSNNNTNSQIASKKLIEHKICPSLLSARDKTQLDKTHMSKILTQRWLVLNIDSLCHFEVGQLKQDAKVKILIPSRQRQFHSYIFDHVFCELLYFS